MSFEHNFSFDPTYGYTLETLKQVGAPPEPTDFAAFWQDTYQQALAVPSRSQRIQIPSQRAGIDAYEIQFNAWNNVRLKGWLLVPSKKPVMRGLVVAHGYGGWSQPAWDMADESTAVIIPCSRGMGLSVLAGVPSESKQHVLHGITSRETYIHRGNCSDYWAAAGVLLEWYPQIAGKLYYHGGSFGGGIGAMVLAWDKRFDRAFLNVPSFGNHPLRVTLDCNGSGFAVRNYYLKHPEVLNVLAYYDAAIAAKYVSIPVLVAAALFDPAVPPPGQFAVYNSLGGHKELFVCLGGHFDFPELTAENQRLEERLKKWFA